MISLRKKRRNVRANDFSALNPTIWANEAIMRLQRNMVLGNMVSRDFDNIPAIFGQIVNARIPATFTMTRKGAPCENVVIQDASGTTMQVALDQWPQVAFLICDGEEDRRFNDILEQQFNPAIDAFSAGIDSIIGGQVYRFMDNWAGRLGQLDETNVKDFVLETKEVMDRNNVPKTGRAMVLTPGSETEALKLDTIVTADKTGDGGTALRDATLGKKYGFTFVSTTGQPEIGGNQVKITGTTTAAYSAGTTVVVASAATGGAWAVGEWAVIAGDDSPQQIVGVATNTLTLSPGLRRDVISGAAITVVKPGTVNNASGYNGTTLSPRVIGYAKEILVAGFPLSAPKIGQLVTFGSSTDRYTITKLRIIDNAVGTFGIELDRPLVSALTNTMSVNLGPAGKYNFALLPQAFALVNRSLAAPRGNLVISRTVNDPVNRIGIRVTISYDPVKQGHLVVLDTLIGVAVLNDDLGAVMGG